MGLVQLDRPWRPFKSGLESPDLWGVAARWSDQLFRREFIDPKKPGYKGDPAELAMGKDLVLRFKSIAREPAGPAAVAASRHNPSRLSPNRTGGPDAI